MGLNKIIWHILAYLELCRSSQWPLNSCGNWPQLILVDYIHKQITPLTSIWSFLPKPLHQTPPRRTLQFATSTTQQLLTPGITRLWGPSYKTIYNSKSIYVISDCVNVKYVMQGNSLLSVSPRRNINSSGRNSNSSNIPLPWQVEAPILPHRMCPPHNTDHVRNLHS